MMSHIEGNLAVPIPRVEVPDPRGAAGETAECYRCECERSRRRWYFDGRSGVWLCGVCHGVGVERCRCAVTFSKLDPDHPGLCEVCGLPAVRAGVEADGVFRVRVPGSGWLDPTVDAETAWKCRKALRAAWTSADYVARYPRTCAHIIAGSLGYATPSTAGRILADADQGRPNFCEWVASCFKTSAVECVKHNVCQERFGEKRADDSNVYGRRSHRGFMSDYPTALALVKRFNEDGAEPDFASWF